MLFIQCNFVKFRRQKISSLLSLQSMVCGRLNTINKVCRLKQIKMLQNQYVAKISSNVCEIVNRQIN